MAESKQEHNFALLIRLFFVLMLYIKFQVPNSSGSLVLQPTKGVMDRRTDGQTYGPKPICPLNFFKVWIIKIKKKEKAVLLSRFASFRSFAFVNRVILQVPEP